MVALFLTECIILLDFNLRPIFKGLVVRVYDLIKDPRMLVATQSVSSFTSVLS